MRVPRWLYRLVYALPLRVQVRALAGLGVLCGASLWALGAREGWGIVGAGVALAVALAALGLAAWAAWHG